MGVTVPSEPARKAAAAREKKEGKPLQISGTEGLEYFSQIAEEGRQAKAEGACRGNVYGTYVHGVFDGDGIAEEMVRDLARKKGICLEERKYMDRHAYKESQYDLLADTLRRHLDMDKIYEILR